MPDPTIPPERWERVCELFYSALERPVVDRPAFLDTACEGDGELRAAVASLLKAHEDELPMALRALEPMDVEERLGEALKGR